MPYGIRLAQAGSFSMRSPGLLHLALGAFTGLSSNLDPFRSQSFHRARGDLRPPALPPRGMAIAVLTFEQSLRGVYRMRVGLLGVQRQATWISRSVGDSFVLKRMSSATAEGSHLSFVHIYQPCHLSSTTKCGC